MASNMGIYGCLAVVALLLHVAAAASIFRVNWITPLTRVNKPAGKIFEVGDILEFVGDFIEDHVADVSKQEYDTCNTTSLGLKVDSTRPVNMTIPTKGPHYYISTDPARCKDGQKLAINVGNSVTSSASPSGSSSSLTVSGFFITLASYIVAFLY